ncbi:MAG: response regulator [Archangium sp.]|nr:response regulator [Archangium sp.]
MKNPNFYTSLEVAKLIDTSRTTVQRWIDAGNLKAFRTIGNHRRVKPEDLVSFLRKQGMPIPSGLGKEAAPRVRILVIDDEARYVKALKAVLERTDKRFEVDIADDSLDGLLAVGARHPDIVLLDAMMPGWDGFEVCRRIKRAPETKDILVVGMSGTAANEEAFRKAGVDAFLKKPFDTQLVVAVVAWLGLGTGASPD